MRGCEKDISSDHRKRETGHPHRYLNINVAFTNLGKRLQSPDNENYSKLAFIAADKTFVDCRVQRLRTTSYQEIIKKRAVFHGSDIWIS